MQESQAGEGKFLFPEGPTSFFVGLASQFLSTDAIGMVAQGAGYARNRTLIIGSGRLLETGSGTEPQQGNCDAWDGM
jgi:hypothetical protein